MKDFIQDRLDALTQIANDTKSQFRHGLSISMRPRNELQLVKKGSVTYNGGEFFEHTYAPDEFSELFRDDWFTNEDLLGLQTVIDIDTFVFAYPKGNVTIAQEDSSLGLFLIAKENANITITTKGNATTRVHILVKGGTVKVNHVISNQAIVHKLSRVEKGSIDWVDVVLTDSYIRAYTQNDLIENESKGTIKSFYITSGDGVCDLYTANRHVGQATESDIVTRGVITDSAKALSRGLVSIGVNAAHSSGYEQQDALLLSDSAEADAIPNLEIHNHDVKCSHGSTVGRVDEERLFYLMSRGLNEKRAKALIIKGYFSPALDGISDDMLRESLGELIDSFLE